MKNKTIGILSLGATLLFNGCNNEAKTADSAASNQPKSVVIGVSSRYKQLDPMVSNDIPSLLITKQLFQSFFNLKDGKIESDLIDSYSLENDILTLVPKKGLKFSDGTDVTLEDFKFSLERAKKSPACAFLIGNIDNVTIDGDKVIVPLKVPTPSIINNMTYPMISLVKESNGNLLGTGAFVVEEAVTDQIKLAPNKYSQNKGQSSVKVVTIPEDSSRTIALETGEISVNLRVPPIDKKLLVSKNFIVDSAPSVTTEMIWLNNEKLDLDTRKLIYSAIDREEIIQAALEGEATPTTSFVPKTAFGYKENPAPIIENIKAYSGRKINIVTNDVNTRKTNAQILQAKLKSVGIEAEIQVLDWGKYLDMSANGEHDILMGGWVTPNYDAEGILKPLFYSKTTPAGGRRTFFNSPEFDAALESSYVYDETTRREKLEAAQEVVFQNYGIVPLYYPNYLVGYNKALKGFTPDPRGLYDFSELKFD